MLAHMIGDGSCIKREPVRYASIDEANLAAVTIAAAHFGITPIRDQYAAVRVTTLRLPSPYRLTHGKRNPIAEWLVGLGLFGLRSYESSFHQRYSRRRRIRSPYSCCISELPMDRCAGMRRHRRAGFATPQQVAA